MTREQARREIDSLDFYLQNHTDDYGEESHTAMMMAKDALSRSENPNTCEDAISRQAVIDILSDKPAFTDTISSMESIFDVKHLPSVMPKQRIGHWIIIDDCEQFIAKCSECGRIEDSRMINNYPYCHCGTRMEVEE